MLVIFIDAYSRTPYRGVITFWRSRVAAAAASLCPGIVEPPDPVLYAITLVFHVTLTFRSRSEVQCYMNSIDLISRRPPHLPAKRAMTAFYALTSRLVPIPAATLASELPFCCAASISFTTEELSCWFMRAMSRRHGELRCAALGADQCRDEAHHVPWQTIIGL